MAYDSSDLSVLAYANNFTLWHYRTQHDSIEAPGYFDKASAMLRVGDLIVVSQENEKEPRVKFYIVASTEKGFVTVKQYS